jgi:hypothetical protein
VVAVRARAGDWTLLNCCSVGLGLGRHGPAGDWSRGAARALTADLPGLGRCLAPHDRRSRTVTCSPGPAMRPRWRPVSWTVAPRDGGRGPDSVSRSGTAAARTGDWTKANVPVLQDFITFNVGSLCQCAGLGGCEWHFRFNVPT